jgi:hypothetical protein
MRVHDDKTAIVVDIRGGNARRSITGIETSLRRKQAVGRRNKTEISVVVFFAVTMSGSKSPFTSANYNRGRCVSGFEKTRRIKRPTRVEWLGAGRGGPRKRRNRNRKKRGSLHTLHLPIK